MLFTYGGWNEAAYLGGEVRDPARNMMRILVMGIVAVTALYVLVNIGYVAALGLQGVRDSKAVAADSSFTTGSISSDTSACFNIALRSAGSRARPEIYPC